jgi:hypothetical protein
VAVEVFESYQLGGTDLADGAGVRVEEKVADFGLASLAGLGGNVRWLKIPPPE